MLNTMIVVKMKKTNFSEWKKLFDGDAENRAKFARDTLVGKVDENTAIGVAEGESATCADIIEEFCNSAIFTTKFTTK